MSKEDVAHRYWSMGYDDRERVIKAIGDYKWEDYFRLSGRADSLQALVDDYREKARQAEIEADAYKMKSDSILADGLELYDKIKDG